MSRAAQRYLDVIAAIPRGETRSFLEVAASAGRSGAARAVARVVNLTPLDDETPWHRVTTSSGGLARDPTRASVQLARLRDEDAIPGDGESVGDWVARTRPAVVIEHRSRQFLHADDPRAHAWRPGHVGRATDEASARSRGFAPVGEPTWRDLPWRLPSMSHAAPGPIEPRLAEFDPSALLERGWTKQRRILSHAACRRLVSLLGQDRLERRIRMERHGYGVGDYYYLAEPLPRALHELRDSLYRRLTPAATALSGREYPASLQAFHERCRAAGQTRGSVILIVYPEGGVNHAHRDLYGDEFFPLQALLVLSRRGRDFDGGDFFLVEERRDGDRRHDLPVDAGDLVVFPSRDGPAGPMRHGMTPVTRGQRVAVGLVFHLAR